MSSRRSAVLITVLVGVMLAACSSPPRGNGGTSTTAAASASATTTAPGSAPATDGAGTVWLCRPGLADDPCAGNLDATVVQADGSTASHPAAPAIDPKADCFYVYPTVSTEPADNANLKVQPAETAVAVAQAARFSQDSAVWAPMYRQRTESSLNKGLGSDPAADAVAYASVLAAWKDYLAHFNHGRPIVFIGHSQGAAMVIRLLRGQIDQNPALRKLLVSAIILGGNVQVPTGRDVGGSFTHIPACRSVRQTGCVVAYSSFPGEPPAVSEFGRPGTGVSLQSGQTATTGQLVLCTNPVALAGGVGVLDTYVPTSASTGALTPVTTPWVEYSNLYTAQCQTKGGATWLQIYGSAETGDHRPQITETLGPAWGFHLDDVNLALGTLVELVAEQEAAYK